MIIIFNSIEELNAVTSPLPSGVYIGIPLVSLDGRVAISHSFTTEDAQVLFAAGGYEVGSIPADWQYPPEDEW